MIDNTEILNDYNFHLQKTQKSKHTSTAYFLNAQRFVDFVGVNVSEITGPHIEAYFEHKKGLMPASLRQAKVSIVNFLQFAEVDFECDVNLPKPENAACVIPSVSDFKKILFYAGEKNNYEAVRNQTILSVLYHAGLRVGEAWQLEIDDVDFDQNNLYVFGKGSKRRVVPMNQSLYTALCCYFAFRPAVVGEQKLFLSAGKNHRLQPLAYGSFRSIINNCFARAGYSNLSPISLRHAFCTNLIRSGADLSVIASLMGHANLMSLPYYFVAEKFDGRDAVQALNF